MSEPPVDNRNLGGGEIIDSTMPPPVSQGRRGSGRPNGLDEGDDDFPQKPNVPGGRNPPAVPDRVETSPRGPVEYDDVRDYQPGQGRGRPGLPADDEVGGGYEGDGRGMPSGPAVPDASESDSTSTDVLAPPQRIPAVGNRRGDVRIEKVAPPTAYVGQPLIYRITVRNFGNGAAQQVLVEDTVPEGVTMQGSIPQAEMTGRRLSWQIGTLAPGEERRISVKVIPGAAGAVGSAATVKFIGDQQYAATDDDQGVQPTSSRTAPRTSPRTIARNAPTGGNGFSLAMDPIPAVSAGRAFQLVFRLTNNTSQPASNLLVRNVLPRHVQHNSGYLDLEYSIQTLAPGETRELPLPLTAREGGRATCRTMIMTGDGQVLSSQEFPVQVEGNTTTASRGAGGRIQPSLAIEIVAPPGPVLVGEQASYALRLWNRGSALVEQATIRVSVPPELTVAHAGPVSYRREGDELVFEPIASLQPGQQTQLRIDFTAQQAGEAYLRVEYGAAHMRRALSREESLQISAN